MLSLVAALSVCLPPLHAGKREASKRLIIIVLKYIFFICYIVEIVTQIQFPPIFLIKHLFRIERLQGYRGLDFYLVQLVVVPAQHH